MLTEGNLQLTNNYLRKRGRNPNSVTLQEKKNIYNAHLKPFPIKFVHNLVNKVSKNVAIQKLKSMGFDENRVRDIVYAYNSPNNTTGFDIYKNKNRLIRLAHAAMNVTRGKKVDIHTVMKSLNPFIRKIATLSGLTSDADIKYFKRILTNLVIHKYGNLTPKQKYEIGRSIGTDMISLSKTYTRLPSSGNYSNLLSGISNSKAPRLIILNIADQRLKKAIYNKRSKITALNKT